MRPKPFHTDESQKELYALQRPTHGLPTCWKPFKPQERVPYQFYPPLAGKKQKFYFKGPLHPKNTSLLFPSTGPTPPPPLPKSPRLSSGDPLSTTTKRPQNSRIGVQIGRSFAPDPSKHHAVSGRPLAKSTACLVIVLLGLQLAGLQGLEDELARSDVVVVVLQAASEVLLVHVAGVNRRLLVSLRLFHCSVRAGQTR